MPIDFRAANAGAALRAAGHRPDRDSFFLCEGLLLYLERPVIAGLLCSLRAAAGPQSTLAASLAVRSPDPRHEARRALAHRRRAGLGEPVRTILEPGEAPALFARAGWTAATITRPGSGALFLVASPVQASGVPDR